MEFYSFENERIKGIWGEGKDRTNSLSNPTVLSKKFDETQMGVFIVPRDMEMRLDLISNALYGSTNYVEELMKINNILNPFSIKQDDVIKYIPVEMIGGIRAREDDVELQNINLLAVDPGKNNTPVQAPPSSKPRSVEQVTVNKKENKIKIINNFKT